MSDRRAGLRDWPNQAASRFVRASGFTWHVQTLGKGPAVLLLLHGTGSATHSWRDLAPLLAKRFTVVAPDLPGHGFTEAPASARMSLPGMAAAVRSLLQVLDVRPRLLVGHSAGAAVGLRLTLDGGVAPAGIVGLNAALQPFTGVAGQIFSPLARVLVGLPLLPQMFAWRARDAAVVEKLLADTGSALDPAGVALYARLVRDPRHAAAALAMMARWDLAPLVADLPRLGVKPGVKLLLVAGENDRTVPPQVSEDAARLVAGARVERRPGQGHLGHETDPAGTAALIESFAAECGVAP